MKITLLIVISFFSLYIGSLIYLFFDLEIYCFFSWLDKISFDHYIFQNNCLNLPSFFVNNLPNALFVIFGYVFIYIIWNNNRSNYYLYTSIITFLSIIYETIANDMSDILTILITFGICSIIYNKMLWRKV